MALVRWDPFREMTSLRKAMERLFDESFVRPFEGWPERGELGLTIPLDMSETDEAVVVRADLPGLKPDDVDISLMGNMLTPKGEFHAEVEGERGTVHFRERHYGKFERSVALPTGVDFDKSEATFANGVLTVTLPKTEKAKPKRLTVKVKS
jgi:HSP20 family protein